MAREASQIWDDREGGSMTSSSVPSLVLEDGVNCADLFFHVCKLSYRALECLRRRPTLAREASQI